MTQEEASLISGLVAREVEPAPQTTPNDRNYITLGDHHRCQLCRLILGRFHLVAFGATWEQALASASAKRPSNLSLAA